MQDHYRTLDVTAAASADEIKRAFRQRIMLYHPDRVQHLAPELQALASRRATEITEAYATLIDPVRRAEYDESRRGMTPATQRGEEEPASEASAPAPETARAPGGAPCAPPSPARPRRAPSSDRREDAMIRRAALARLSRAIAGSTGETDHPPAGGFDVSRTEGRSLLGPLRRKTWLLGRFVPCLDTDHLRTAGEAAIRVTGRRSAACVFLLAARVERASEIPPAVAALRERVRARYESDLLIIPIDVRTWHVVLPPGAPRLAREVVDRLRQDR